MKFQVCAIKILVTNKSVLKSDLSYDISNFWQIGKHNFIQIILIN